jgi:glycosyltransferase involved in cell wall biosynthesis
MPANFGRKIKTHRVKNICLLWHSAYPWDVRLEKFINTLSPSHGIFLLCKGKKGFPGHEEKDDIVIERVGTGGGILDYPLFVNPFWKRALHSMVERNHIGALIVRDLPLMGLGIEAGRKYGIPVVFDMAENYPAALVAYEKWPYKPFLVFNAFLPKLYERYAVRNASRVIVVTEEQRERIGGFRRSRGAKESDIVLVSNTPVLSELPEGAPPETGGGSEKRLLYTGKVDIHRGVETALRAVSILKKTRPEIKLVIAGTGRDIERLKKMTSAVGAAGNIEFVGWVPHDEMYALIRKSHVCLIPHLKSEHTDTTLPNKLFDYMALAKPVVSSDLAPVARILKECACGVVYKSGDAEDLSAQIESLLDGGAGLGENGRKAVLNKYNWGEDSKRLRDAVGTL